MCNNLPLMFELCLITVGCWYHIFYGFMLCYHLIWWLSHCANDKQYRKISWIQFYMNIYKMIEEIHNFENWNLYFLAATKQLYDWFSPSVCPSVCLSVRHTFFTMFVSSYHHEIFRSYYHGQKWCPCKRSRSEVKGQGHRGQRPT